LRRIFAASWNIQRRRSKETSAGTAGLVRCSMATHCG